MHSIMHMYIKNIINIFMISQAHVVMGTRNDMKGVLLLIAMQGPAQLTLPVGM